MLAVVLQDRWAGPRHHEAVITEQMQQMRIVDPSGRRHGQDVITATQPSSLPHGSLESYRLVQMASTRQRKLEHQRQQMGEGDSIHLKLALDISAGPSGFATATTNMASADLRKHQGFR